MLTLYYLPLRARGEAIRLILAYGEIPYKDVIAYYPNWTTTMKGDTTRFPFGQLPVLELPSGLHLAQSGAILRYVAKLANVYPEDLERAAIADMVLETAMEMNPINPILNFFPVGSDLYTSAYATYFAALPARLASLQNILGDELFYGGDKISHGDFLLFHILDNTVLVKPDALTDYPKLVEWKDRVASIPQVKKYLENRPGPSDVGKDGTLIKTFV